MYGMWSQVRVHTIVDKLGNSTKGHKCKSCSKFKPNSIPDVIQVRVVLQ